MFKRSKIILLISTFFLLNLTFSGLLTEKVMASSILFQDDFNNNSLSNWISKNYIVEEGGSFASVGQLSISSFNQELKISGQASLGIIEVDGIPVGNIGRALVYKTPITVNNKVVVQTDVYVAQGEKDYVLLVFLDFDGNNRIIFDIQSATGGKVTQLIFDEQDNIRCPINNESNGCYLKPFNYNNNEIVNLEFEFDPTTKKVVGYVNNIEQLWGTYDGEIKNANVGIATTIFGENSPNSSYIDSRYDNFKIISEISNNLNVSDLKQFDPKWGGQEYDKAGVWSPQNPTISRWGCALTSAAMVLQYYNHNIDPEGLNNWLKSQKDGFTSNGSILWPTISRWTKLHESANSPILEFSYHNPDYNYLTSEINSSRPPLLKMQKNGNTHFMVAKGINGSDYNINDPASDSSQIKLLSQTNSKWGNLAQIGTFTKSHTDLSYITLFLKNGFEFKVTDDLNNAVGGEYFNEGPLVAADDENINSGSLLKAFYLPKPTLDKYVIEVSGDGNFQLESYLYDIEGNSFMDNIVGDVTTGNPKYYDIYLDNDKRFIFPHDNSDRFGYLERNIDNAYANNLIFDLELHDSLLSLLKNAEKQLEKGKTFTCGILLRVVLFKINHITPTLIDEDYSQILQEQIQLLIDSI